MKRSAPAAQLHAGADARFARAAQRQRWAVGRTSVEATYCRAAASITLESVAIASPTPPHTYLGVAESMMPGVNVLAAAPKPCALALALLAAHVLECLLKAYLSRGGSDAPLKKPAVRHNLNALWAMASAQGLQVQKKPPSWVDRLGVA